MSANKTLQKPTEQKKAEQKKPVKQSKLKINKLAEQLVNPSAIDDVVLTPAEFPTTSDVKKFTRVVELKSNIGTGGSGAFAIRVRPNALEPLTVTWGEAIPPSGPEPGLIWQCVSACASADVDGRFPLTSTLACRRGETFIGEVEPAIVDGLMCYPVQLFSAGNFIQLYMLGPPAHYQFQIHTGGAWVLVDEDTLIANLQENFGDTLPDFDAFRISCRTQTFSLVKMAMKTGLSKSWVPASEFTYKLFQTQVVNLGQVERARVTALSLLATFTGNALQSGGVIAAARTQPGFSLTGSSYQALTKLVDHCYNGPLVEGAYVWWLPGSYKEMEFSSELISDAGTTDLILGGNFSDPDGSLRLELNVVVEFYSPLQIFSHRLGPALTDEWVELLNQLNTIPAASCNPKHTELFKQIMSAGSKALRKSGEYIVANPQLFASLIASLL